MVALGESFFYACEIGGSLLIGLIFFAMAVTTDQSDNKWKMIVGAVLCLCMTIFFIVLYVSSKKEKAKQIVSFK